MTFSPIVPFGGLSGWSYMQRTRETQQELFEKSPVLLRNVDAFAERIGKITSAQELVADRQLLEVALGAFGLDEDINNRYYIEKIMTSDLDDRASLANRMADKRYESLTRAFGFSSPDGPSTGEEGFAEKIIAAYKDRQFEIAVGESDTDLRLAMSMERDLTDVIGSEERSDDARWYSMMALAPLRQIFETALGLPKSFGALDLDRQLSEFRDKAQRVFGTRNLADFNTPEMREELTRMFLIRAEINAGLGDMTSRGSIALALLTS